MKRYTAYFAYLIIFSGLSTTHYTLEARGFFEALADFFYALGKEDNLHHESKFTLSRKQAQEYIDLYIATLAHDLRYNASDYDIQRITDKTYTTFDQSSTVYIWVSGVRRYNKDLIDQFLLSAIVEVVESNTYSYAYDQSKNSKLAAHVAQTIRTRLMDMISKKRTLNAYDLQPFFGYTFRQAVQTEIAYGLPHNYGYTGTTGSTGHTGRTGATGHTGRTGATGSTGARYASPSCCICLDDFGSATQRVFLSPCGHDMCKTCARDYFFPNNWSDHAKKCPICRSSVDLDTLYNDVF